MKKKNMPIIATTGAVTETPVQFSYKERDRKNKVKQVKNHRQFSQKEAGEYSQFIEDETKTALAKIHHEEDFDDEFEEESEFEEDFDEDLDMESLNALGLEFLDALLRHQLFVFSELHRESTKNLAHNQAGFFFSVVSLPRSSNAAEKSEPFSPLSSDDSSESSEYSDEPGAVDSDEEEDNQSHDEGSDRSDGPTM